MPLRFKKNKDIIAFIDENKLTDRHKKPFIQKKSWWFPVNKVMKLAK